MADLMDIYFGVATQNIPAAKGQAGDLSPAVTKAIAAAAGAQAGWIGFQETSEDEDNAALDAALPPKNWYHLNARSENDLMVRRSRWVADIGGIIPLSKGLSGVSPNRDLSYAPIRFLENPKFTTTIFGSFHLVSGVYKGNNHYAERLAMRNNALSALQTWVAKWHDQGLNVMLVADTNWTAMPKLHPAQEWLVNDGIDKIMWIPAETSTFDLALVGKPEVYDNASDHNLRVANVRATANARFPKPPVVLTKEQRIAAWQSKYSVSLSAYDELQAILSS